MSAIAWTLNDETLPEIGISQATWTVSASGATSLTVTQAASLSASPKWAGFAPVVLKADGVEVFRGWLDQAPRRAAGNAEGWQYAFTGPLRLLDRQIYEQPLKVLGYNADTGTTLTILDPTGQTMLGLKSAGDGTLTPYSLTHATIREVIEEILDQIQDEGFTYTLPGTGLTAEVPWESREDDTVLHALRTIQKWTPDLCLRWSGLALTVVRPDLAGAVTLTVGSFDATQLNANPRYDLACESVTIKFLRRRVTPPIYDITTDAATGGVSGGRLLVKSIFLEDGEPVPASGIAAEFLSWSGRLHIDATIPLLGIDLTRQVGIAYKIDNALGGLGTIPTVCQQITRELITDTETLTLGVPGYLGLDDLIALKRKPYRRPDPGDSGEPEESGTVTIDISGPDDGVWSTGDATWSVADQSGSGTGAELELPPGNYTVIFNPVFKPADGKLYFANAFPVTVTNGGSHTASAAYLGLSKLILASETGDETLELSQNAMKLYDDDGDGVYVDIAGWIQQKKEDKEIFLDPEDVPEGSDKAGFMAADGFGGITDGEEC